MKFANIHMAHLFWLALGLAGLNLWAFKFRRKTLEAFAQKELLPELMSSFDERKKYLKLFLLNLAVLLIFFALMRPQWGFHWQEIKHQGLDILIAIDTSKSMLAQDVKPNRLERAKLAVKDFLKNIKGDRIGLIAFSGEAFLQSPLTVDYNGFLLSLESLSVDIIPKGGTSLSGPIREALKSYDGGMKKHKVLILITDGEDHKGDSLLAAEEAKKEGIKIFCIGIGTPEGELISITDEKGNKKFLKDRKGNFVKTRLDETSLLKIALTTGGSYVRASGAKFGLNLIYEQRLAKMEKRDFKSKMVKQYEERFQIFLACAILLLLIEPFVNERKKRL